MIKCLVPSEAAFSTLSPRPSDSLHSPSPCSGVNTNTDALGSIRHWLWPQNPRGQVLRFTSVSPALSRSLAYSWHLESLSWKFPWLCWTHSGDESVPASWWVDQYTGSVIKIMLLLYSFWHLCPLFPQVWAECLLHAGPVLTTGTYLPWPSCQTWWGETTVGADTWGRPPRRQERLPREAASRMSPAG